MLSAGLMLFVFGVVSVFGWQWTSPQPDYYMLFLTDLAEQHHHLTGTITVIRESDHLLDYLQHLYNRKAHIGEFSAESIRVRRARVIHFAFIPGASVWEEFLFADLAENRVAPSMTFTEPSGKPLALWVFSRPEQALAVVFAEQPMEDELVKPGPKVIETVNRSGVAAVVGDFKSAKVGLVDGYLLPLDGMGLESSGEWVGDSLAVERVVGALPLLFGAGARSSEGQKQLNAARALAQLRGVSTASKSTR